jgi:hypothetical protein
MLGLTKKQFLKRGKTCLEETGAEALLMRELITLEKEENISKEEAHLKINLLRRSIESTFFGFDDLNPPSKCVPLQLSILNSLIILQEVLAINYEYLNASDSGDVSKASEKLEESQVHLEKFRKEFRPLTHKIDKLLPEKISRLNNNK